MRASQQLIDWQASGFNIIAAGSQLNSGLYDGNVSSALYVNNGANSNVDLGVRVSGLSEGIYDAFVTSKNTNTTFDEQYRIYTMLVDPASGNTNYSGVTPIAMVHGLDNQWRHGESFVADTFQIIGNKDLVVVVEGISPNELRGFLNTLEIVKLSGILSADVNRDGDIDLDDFSMIRQHYLTTVTLGTNGDANSDGIVNHKDFYFWREAYLNQSGGSASDDLSIPEPSSIASLLVVAPLLSYFWPHAWLSMRQPVTPF